MPTTSFCQILLGIALVAASSATATAEDEGAAIHSKADDAADRPVPPSSAVAATESLWTQWRGPQRDGTSPGGAWPESLGELAELWRAELGKGYSGPVVSADRVFIAETVDGQNEGARAFDRHTGREVWNTRWAGTGKVPFFAARNGDWIRATPAYDGDALYVGGMEEVLYKLSAATGDLLWRIDFPERFSTPIPDFGFASSPLIDGTTLYVQAANSIVKIDTRSGNTIWRALENDGDMERSGAFSSPILAELAGREQLVVQTREVLYGLDPSSGEILWSQAVPSFRGMNILTPVIHGDRIFTSTHRNASYLYEISGGPEGLHSTELWSHKAQGYMSSPVVVDGIAYLHLGNGRLTAIDLDSGAATWTSTPHGSYWSLVVRGDKILGLNDDGELFLLQVGDLQPTILDRRQVSEQSTWGHLAVSGEQIFVRELQGLAVYQLR